MLFALEHSCWFWEFFFVCYYYSIKCKTLSLANVQHTYYNGSNILTHLWSISSSWQCYSIHLCGTCLQIFFNSMCTLQCMPKVSNRICVYKYLNRATLAVVTLCTDTASTLVVITDRTYWTLWRWCPAKLLLLHHITLFQCWNTNKISGKIVFQCRE